MPAGAAAPKAACKDGAQEATDDGALLVGAARRDLAAFEALYRRYHPRLRRFLQRLVRGPATVEEVLNDTMFATAGRFDPRATASTWIFGIAWRRAVKAVGRVDHRAVVMGDDVPDQAATGHGPEAHAIAQETRVRLARAIGRLPADQQAVIALTYFEGCSCQEVATIMGCPVNSVRTRMFHARRRLRGFLAEGTGDGR